MKNTISELNYTVEGIKSRLDEAEDWIREKNSQKEKEKEKKTLRKDEEV